MAKGADPMRMAIVFALFAGATFLAPETASAVPLALGDHATLSRMVSDVAVEPVAHRYLAATNIMRANTRAATTGPITPIGGRTSITIGSSTIPMAARCSEPR
jgi:hypothetical protein